MDLHTQTAVKFTRKKESECTVKIVQMSLKDILLRNILNLSLISFTSVWLFDS